MVSAELFSMKITVASGNDLCRRNRKKRKQLIHSSVKLSERCSIDSSKTSRRYFMTSVDLYEHFFRKLYLFQRDGTKFSRRKKAKIERMPARACSQVQLQECKKKNCKDIHRDSIQ